MPRLLISCLVAAMGCLLLTRSLPAADADAAQEIVDKAIKAHGGADALAKVKMFTRNDKGEIAMGGQSAPFTRETIVSLPDKCRWAFVVESGTTKNPVTCVLNGDKGWRLGGGATQELKKQEIDDFREDAFVSWLSTLVPLKDKDITLKVIDNAKIGDDPVLALSVSSKGHGDVKLYFDKTNHLLLKAERAAKEAGIAFTKDYLYSDYKDFEGVKLPTRFQEMSNGKNKLAEWTATSYKLMPKVDDSAFAKP